MCGVLRFGTTKWYRNVGHQKNKDLIHTTVKALIPARHWYRNVGHQKNTDLIHTTVKAPIPARHCYTVTPLRRAGSLTSHSGSNAKVSFAGSPSSARSDFA